jgi:hypothetical protein
MSTTLTGAPAPRAFRPSPDQVVEFLQQNAVFGETERYRGLDRREAFLKGLQYAHQKIDWWGEQADVTETISGQTQMPRGFEMTGPSQGGKTVRDLRPTAPKNLGKTIPKRYTSLLFSQARKPKVVVEQDPDTDAFLEAVRQQSKFWSRMRAARTLAGGMGGVVMVANLREGRFRYDIHNIKHCTPIWDDAQTFRLMGLLIMKQYSVEQNKKDEDGKVVGTEIVQYVSRQIITETDDIRYKPVRLDMWPSIEWTPDPQQSTHNNLGFFPGVWIQNKADSEDEDGVSDCEGAYQTIDTIDRLIAQMNKGTLLNLDPTVVAKYDEKEVEAIGGLTGSAPGLAKGSDNAITPGKSGDAKYMEISGSGIEAGIKLLSVLMQTVTELTSFVNVDPDKISGAAQSAKAIEYIMAPMLECADDLRDQFGEAIIELMQITERMARKFAGTSVQLPPAADGTPRIGVFSDFKLPMRKVQIEEKGTVVERLEPQKLGPGGQIVLEWPPYFAPTVLDESNMIKNAAGANAAGFVDKVTAARTIAPLFSVTDVEGVVAKAREEGQDDAERALAGLEGGVKAEKTLITGKPDTNPLG